MSQGEYEMAGDPVCLLNWWSCLQVFCSRGHLTTDEQWSFIMGTINPPRKQKQQPTRIAVVTRGVEPDKNGNPKRFIAILAKVDSTGAPVKGGIIEKLMGPDPEFPELEIEVRFPSSAKADAAGLMHWPQAEIDVDEKVRKFDERYVANRSDVVKKYREDQEALQAVRSMAAREGISIDEATAKLKEAAKAAKLVEVVDAAEVFAK